MNKNDKLLKKALLENNTALTPQETQALRTLLDATPEARRKYARMRSLIKTARAARGSTPTQPPEGLTDEVMARIAALPAARPVSGPSSLQTLSAQGLGYVFIAFALFYCVIGVCMHLALADVTTAGLPDWIWRQPRIALLSALLFGLCGVLLLRRGRKVARALYLTLTGYMLCLALNALQVQLTAGASALALGLIGYMGGGLVICLFLGDLLRRLPQTGWRKATGA